MKDIWRRVENFSQPVTAEICHNAHPVGFREGLDRVADVAKGIAGLHDLDPAHQRVMGHVDQPLCLARQLTRDIHARVIPVPAIDNHGDVDVQDIAILQLFVTGDAVADDMVD